MRDLKSGPNVVSSLVRWNDREAALSYRDLPLRRDYLKSMLWPFGRGRPWAPSLIETLVRSLNAGQMARKPVLSRQELLFTPPLPPNVDLLTWKHHREVAASARLYAEQAIEDRSLGAPEAWSLLLGPDGSGASGE